MNITVRQQQHENVNYLKKWHPFQSTGPIKLMEVITSIKVGYFVSLCYRGYYDKCDFVVVVILQMW